MAKANFRINYINGSPDLDRNEETMDPLLVWFDPAIGDLSGGCSALENVSDQNQQQVLCQVEGDPVEIARMKTLTDRYTFVEDISA